MFPADLGLVYLCVFDGVVLTLLLVRLLAEAGLLYLCEGCVAGFVFALLALAVDVLEGFLYEYLCLVVLAGFCFEVVVLSFVDDATSAPVVPATPLIAGLLLCDLLKFPVVVLPPDRVWVGLFTTSLVVFVGVERVIACEFVVDELRVTPLLKVLGLLS